jgi:hypothetical protein
MADLSSHPASLIFRAAQVAKPFMQKPPLSFWQIWNMSFGFLAAVLTLLVVTFKKTNAEPLPVSGGGGH